MASTLFACSEKGTLAEGEDIQELARISPSALLQELRERFDFRPLSEETYVPVGNSHIIDQAAAVRLGKIFFWDVQPSSDGKVACASCHHEAGADSRRINTINPGADGMFASGGVTGPGQRFHPTLITNDDVVGSQGVALAEFGSIHPDPTVAADICTPQVDPTFGTNRQVVFRQAPTVFGAGLQRQLFWGGEASNDFNGISIWGFGPNSFGSLITRVTNAPLASQAVGPISNFLEMSCLGRAPVGSEDSLGSKMFARPPLQFQRVSPTDSVLGALANPDGPGLLCDGAPCTYYGLVQAAFGTRLADLGPRIFTVLWGEAVQAYEQTLLPDQTPFDRFLAGDLRALSPKQLFGLATFVGRGNCAACHSGSMLTDATTRFRDLNGATNREGGDQGFHNTGLLNRPNDDTGRGGAGPADFPLSESGSTFDQFAFKTPTLRNVKMTAPFFHNGSNPTLEDVVEFYNRGGDAANPQLSPDVRPLHLTAFEKSALVDFMANALTDRRVEKHAAPFDHPELAIVNGRHLRAVGAEGYRHRHHHDDHDCDEDHDDDDDDHHHGRH